MQCTKTGGKALPGAQGSEPLDNAFTEWGTRLRILGVLTKLPKLMERDLVQNLLDNGGHHKVKYKEG